MKLSKGVFIVVSCVTKNFLYSLKARGDLASTRHLETSELKGSSPEWPEERVSHTYALAPETTLDALPYSSSPNPGINEC